MPNKNLAAGASLEVPILRDQNGVLRIGTGPTTDAGAIFVAEIETLDGEWLAIQLYDETAGGIVSSITGPNLSAWMNVPACIGARVRRTDAGATDGTVFVEWRAGSASALVAGAGGGGAGDASAANQVTEIAKLTSIDGKTPALVGGAVPVADTVLDALDKNAGTTGANTLRVVTASDGPLNTATGGINDAKVATDAVGSISAKLRGLVAMAAAWTRGAGVVTAETQRTTLASDDPAVATLGATTGAAVITDANGTVQQYLRGLVKLLVAQITVLLGAGEAHVGSVGGLGIEIQDSWARPADTTAYAANDRVSATTSDTGTTALRSLALARVNAGTGYITYWEIISDLTTFLPAIRVHVYTVAAPTTALAGDNAQFAAKFANALQRVGSFDMPALALPAGTGSDLVRAVRDDLRIAFKCAGGDNKVYYTYETLAAATPASSQNFKQIIRSDVD